MAVSYKRLWKLLIDKDMRKKDLEKQKSIYGCIDKVYGKTQKGERSRSKDQTLIEPLPHSFAVCKVVDTLSWIFLQNFVFRRKLMKKFAGMPVRSGSGKHDSYSG